MARDDLTAAVSGDVAPAGGADDTIRSRCANCGADLLGPWCHACGQHSRDLHRSVARVLREWFADLLNFDRRVWTTLPDLVLNPARLTRRFLAGHRVPQLPPLRMFLVVLVLLFMAGSVDQWVEAVRPSTPIFTYMGSTPETGRGKPGVGLEKLSAEQKREISAEIAKMSVGVGNQRNAAATVWLQKRLDRVLADPKAFNALFMKWAQRLAILMLPISTGFLALLFVRRREVMLFDHMIFAMHSLSFQGLLLTIVTLVNLARGGMGDWLLLAAPVHLFAHMHGVYPAPIPATVLRVALLCAGAGVAFIVLLFGILLAGLVELGAA